MSDLTYTGGPAFPYHKQREEDYCTGMELRDYFAAQALNGIMSRTDGRHPEDNHNKIAEWCYGIADEMLKARYPK